MINKGSESHNYVKITFLEAVRPAMIRLHRSVKLSIELGLRHSEMKKKRRSENCCRFRERTTMVDIGAPCNNCTALEFNESFISAASLPATCQILIQPLELSAVFCVSRFRFNPTDGVCNLSLYLVGFCNQSAFLFLFFTEEGKKRRDSKEQLQKPQKKKTKQKKLFRSVFAPLESRIKTHNNEGLKPFTCER